MKTTTQFIGLTLVTILLISIFSCSSSQNTPLKNMSANLTTEASFSSSQKKVNAIVEIDLKTTAKSIGEASTKITKSFKLSFEDQEVTQMVPSLKIESSSKHEQDAKWIKGELYYAFEQNLPDRQMVVLSEVIVVNNGIIKQM